MTLSLRKRLLSAFPVPRFLEMPAVGIDISDFSVKYVEFIRTRHGVHLNRFGGKKVPSGIIVSGEIKKHGELATILKELRKEHNLEFIHASLPEEKGYLFETVVPGVSSGELRGSLEFKLEENVPLKPENAVFDYDAIRSATDGKGKEKQVVVSAFALPDVESYVDLFTAAGLVPVSFEVEAQAVARSVVPRGSSGVYMVVDFGRTRTGVSIVSGGVVHFTTTVAIAGDDITKAIKKHRPNVSHEEIVRIKNEHGVTQRAEDDAIRSAIEEQVRVLSDEMRKYAAYWKTHGALPAGAPVHKDHTIDRIILCGGNANLAGLPEYLSGTLRVPAERANVWTNAFSLDEHVPNIDFNHSLGFAPAIGLALHGMEHNYQN